MKFGLATGSVKWVIHSKPPLLSAGLQGILGVLGEEFFFFFSLYQLRAKRQIRTTKRMGKSGIKQRFRLFYIPMDEIIKEFPTDTSNDKSLVPLSPGVYPMVEVLYIDFVFGD